MMKEQNCILRGRKSCGEDNVSSEILYFWNVDVKVIYIYNKVLMGDYELSQGFVLPKVPISKYGNLNQEQERTTTDLK